MTLQPRKKCNRWAENKNNCARVRKFSKTKRAPTFFYQLPPLYPTHTRQVHHCKIMIRIVRTGNELFPYYQLNTTAVMRLIHNDFIAKHHQGEKIAFFVRVSAWQFIFDAWNCVPAALLLSSSSRLCAAALCCGWIQFKVYLYVRVYVFGLLNCEVNALLNMLMRFIGGKQQKTLTLMWLGKVFIIIAV